MINTRLTYPNYCATVVALSQFVDIPNCDRIKAAMIFGNHVIVDKSSQPGDVGLFFPVETQLSHAFLYNNSLYSDRTANLDPNQKGFFEHTGRVKAANFRGHKSQGFFVPLKYLTYLDYPESSLQKALSIGTDFNALDDNEICRKYTIRNKKDKATTPKSPKPRTSKLRDKIVPGQFEFHVETSKLERNLHRLLPNDIISITDKWHGTSVGIHKLLVTRPLTLWEKIADWFGAEINHTKYSVVWHSRKVIKGVGRPKEYSCHFYKTDIWGEVASVYANDLPEGCSVYGEIVGYAGNRPIQKGYTYQLEPNEWSFRVYRVTLVGPDNKAMELGYNDMKRFCEEYGMDVVKPFYYGLASEFGSKELRDLGSRVVTDMALCDPVDIVLGLYESDLLKEWQEKFFDELKRDYVEGRICAYNPDKPAEGVVLRIEHGVDTAFYYKVKNHAFLVQESKALDTGEEDIETAQCAVEEEELVNG